MSKFIKKQKKTGQSPGTLTFTGDKKLEKVKIDLIDYDVNSFIEKKLSKIEESFKFKEKDSVTWINIDGLHDVELIEKIGVHYNIHHLTLEDILQVEQRAKIEFFDNYVFVVMNMLSYNDKINTTESEQVSFILGKNFVISFQEGKEGDVFEPIRERIRTAKSRIRNMGADYLNYVLIDIIIDNYFYVLEKLGENIEEQESELIERPEENILNDIYNLKREILFLRKAVFPIRELAIKLQRAETELITDKTEVFLRDLYDHAIQVIETIDTYREMVSGLLDLYLSSVSNRMNQVMRVLTTISTIFIPLTFIAGVYGMNFKNMPELETKYGYIIIWIVMILIGIGMYFYFKRKKWL